MVETGLPPDAGTVNEGDLTIEEIIEEKKVFDLSVNFERFGVDDANRGWSLPGTGASLMVSMRFFVVALLFLIIARFFSTCLPCRGPDAAVSCQFAICIN